MGRLNIISVRWSVLVWAGVLVVSAWSSVAPASAQEDAPEQAQEDVAEALDEAAQAEAQAQDQADEAIAQAALASELASVSRFEAEVAALLQPDGQLDTTQGDDALAKLASLSTRCGILANSAMHDEVRFALLGYQARTLAALAAFEPADDPQEPGRLDQLLEVASQIKALDLPGAQATADYWDLLASLASPAEINASPAEAQAIAEGLLESYIDNHQGDTHAAEFLIDTRLSLAQLLDQRGAQRQVVQLLNQVGKLPPDSPRLGEVKRLRGSAARLGTPIQIDSLSTQLQPWRSADHLGKPVLVHVYSDSVGASVRMIDAISRRIVNGSLSGIAVVSLRVGEPIASTVSPPWPTLPVELEPKGAIDQLGADALPTLAWLDQNGQLASIGTTASVLDQLASIRAKVYDEPAVVEPDAEGANEPPDVASEPEQPDALEPAETSEPGEDTTTESETP